MSNPLRNASKRIIKLTEPSKILNDKVIENDDEFKLFAAIQAGDAIIEFYDLKENKFVKEISITKPFLVSVKMSCWTPEYPSYMHKVYAYNKKLSTMLNERLRTKDIKLNLKHDRWPGREQYEKDCLKAYKALRREITKALCETREQAILMTKFLFLSSRYNYSSGTIKIGARFSRGISKTDWKSEVLPCYAELEKKLIELGVNVKYLYYYDLIGNHILFSNDNEKLNASTVKDYLFFDLVEKLPINTKHVFQREDNSIYEQCAFLHKSGYYFSVIDKRFKNTTKKVLDLLRVNSLINASLIPKKIRSDVEFNVHCLKNNYKKIIATNEDTYTPEFVLALTNSLHLEYGLSHLGLIPRKFILKAMADKSVAREMFSLVNAELDTILATPKKAQESSVIRREFESCMTLIAPLLPKEYFTKSFLEKLISVIHKTVEFNYQISDNDWELDEPILRSVSADMKNVIFAPALWTRFKASDRKNHEHDAIEFMPANLNHCVKKIRESDLVYSVAWQDFTAIRFNKVCGKKIDYKKIAQCLDLAIRSLANRNLDRTSRLFSRPDPYMLHLLEQLGSAQVSVSDIYYRGYPKEVLKNLLKACNMKIFEEKYPSKGKSETKRLKI